MNVYHTTIQWNAALSSLGLGFGARFIHSQRYFLFLTSFLWAGRDLCNFAT